MTTTARVYPVGERLTDGYQTLIAFAADSNISLWEISVKPPGLDGGEPTPTTTMHNTDLRTFAPKALKTMTPCTVNVAYDPRCYNALMALINVNGWITIHFPNGDTIDFVGYLQRFEPGDNQEGAQPTASITIVPTNQLAGTETDFVFTSATGTGTN